MEIDRYDRELCLANNTPLRLPPDVRITCTAGIVWLTVAGEAGDVFLMPGESHHVRGRGLALLEAIGSGQVRLEPVRRSLPARLHAALIWLRQYLPHRGLNNRYRPLQLRACSRQVNA
jgi:hypothetical protein